MSRLFVGACALVALFVLNVDGQEGKEKPKLLASKGWGSLTGRVTYEGKLPDLADLKPNMMKHNDKGCCLDPKAPLADITDQSWVIDPKTKGVANVMVYLKVPEGVAMPTHPTLKRRPNHVIDQPFCAFNPRISGYNPVTFDEAKGDLVPTKQKLTIKNSAVVSHNVRALAQAKFGNKSFNENLPPKTEAVKEFNPQALPVSIQCDVHTWMTAKLFVFDHPYYVVTNKDGVFEFPFVPAGVEIGLSAWHEEVGFLLPQNEGVKEGRKMTFKDGPNTFDFGVTKPKMP